MYVLLCLNISLASCESVLSHCDNVDLIDFINSERQLSISGVLADIFRGEITGNLIAGNESSGTVDKCDVNRIYYYYYYFYFYFL